ncbi:Leucine rich repeat-containing protein [Butyrivibrio sp. ob235]|uniref:leucine-rich repeat protein n=1 Tax=Butyrivibrio sp. ob235 TaxID=1761780 RepID=UPI0008D43EDC|nr:leucine-rich repeat protein [Butyrivibrio sp. ob235]SEM56455.1 Leucine rich repeat-containing protein [Butyrivibrio sp. ob235]
MKKRKALLSIVLTIVMAISTFTGFVPGACLKVQAEGTTYSPASEYNGYGILNSNDTTVQLEGVKYDGTNVADWYVIGYDSAGQTVTLLSKQSFGSQKFNSSDSNSYENSTIKGFVEGLTGEDKPLAGIKDALADISGKVTGDPDSISGAVPYLLSYTEENTLSPTKKSGTANSWWLRSPGNLDGIAACVIDGYADVDGSRVSVELAVRPALKLNLESVIFKSESGSYSFALKPAGYSVTLSGGANATTSGGATSQTGFIGAMTTVTYTANTGYYFAEFADITNNGITATRTSSTVVTVSGTPTADATITVPNAVEKTAATVTTAPTAKSLTYTGSAQELVTAGTASGGTMQYALGTATEATGAYAASIPTATEAGTYYVWYKAVGDDSHNDSEPAYVTVTIESGSGNGVEETKNPDGSRTVTEVKETKDGTSNITVTNYNSKDEQISQYVFKQTKGTTLDLKNVNSKNLKTVVVPGAVKANGKTYKVTRIRKGFLKNCKQATKVDIGKNINTIDKNAFNYGKKVKTVIIRGKLKKVGKGAFKKTKKNVIIKVKTGAKNFEKNKTLLEKSGLPKNATVKRVKNKK